MGIVKLVLSFAFALGRGLVATWLLFSALLWVGDEIDFGPVECDDQPHLEAAQEELQESIEFGEREDVRSLDPDGDGIACEHTDLPTADEVLGPGVYGNPEAWGSGDNCYLDPHGMVCDEASVCRAPRGACAREARSRGNGRLKANPEQSPSPRPLLEQTTA